jgi:TolA-binding protein
MRKVSFTSLSKVDEKQKEIEELYQEFLKTEMQSQQLSEQHEVRENFDTVGQQQPQLDGLKSLTDSHLSSFELDAVEKTLTKCDCSKCEAKRQMVLVSLTKKNYQTNFFNFEMLDMSSVLLVIFIILNLVLLMKK